MAIYLGNCTLKKKGINKIFCGLLDTVQVGLFLGPSNVITDPLLYMDMSSKWLVVCEGLEEERLEY